MTARWMMVLGVLVACCICASTTIAGTAPVPIEGRLLITGGDAEGVMHGYFMDGSSDAIVEPPVYFDMGDISPDTTRVAYTVRTGSGLDLIGSGDLWVANADGTGAVNLTGPAGLGGVNCAPRWSPDGSMIAFHHATPSLGQRTCDAGFQIWLMSADGTDFHQWIPAADYATWWPSWAPDQYYVRGYGWGVGYLTADVTGADITILSDVVGGDGEWSKDGLRVTYSMMVPDTVGGESGIWRQLVLADADGGNAQVIVEQFLKDSDIAAHVAKYGFIPADHDWLSQIQTNAGPQQSRWSPLGDQVAFVAALPFDPDGPEFWYQREIWSYDLGTGEITQLTEDAICENTLSWAGPNTSSVSQTVTVGDVTVTFSDVISEGVTTILRDDDPPDVPTGYLFDYGFYEFNTTAEITGPATICMSYDDADVPEGEAEEQLAILHYSDALQAWEDITTSRDPVGNVVCGQTDTLSPIAFYGVRRTRFPDVPAWGYGDSELDPYWAYYHVMACVQAGIVAGYEDGTYQPTMAVTRDQMAVYVARALAGGDGDVPEGPATATFVDVPKTHWAYRHVEYAVAQNVVQGYDATHYGPANVVDRGQMAVFIGRAMVAPGGDAAIPDPVSPHGFPDVPSTFWAYKQVEYCAGEGVVQGYDDGYYHPERQVTRDQMAVYVARAFDLPF